MESYEKRKIKEQFLTLEIKNIMNQVKLASASADGMALAPVLPGDESLQDRCCRLEDGDGQ